MNKVRLIVGKIRSVVHIVAISGNKVDCDGRMLQLIGASVDRSVCYLTWIQQHYPYVHTRL